MSSEDSIEAELNPSHLSSESESEGETEEADTTATSMTPDVSLEPRPGPSQTHLQSLEPELDCEPGPLSVLRRRPATTECAGTRTRINLPPRPSTAHGTRNQAPSRLQVLNTLMDEEWRCSGSRLTSQRPVCGNIARALRRPLTARQANLADDEKLLVEQSIENASNIVAKEIPRAPNMEDWVEFKKLTGIDIDINFDFDARPGDANSAMDRLERIERETLERLKEEAISKDSLSLQSVDISSASVTNLQMKVPGECDTWGETGLLPHRFNSRLEVDMLFKTISVTDIGSLH